MEPTVPAQPNVWPCVNYRDAHAAIAFLTKALGFVVAVVHDRQGHVEHSELHWPEGGGIMLGSAATNGTPFERLPTGACGVYVVTRDPDAAWRRALAAGARVVKEITDEPYGSRGFVVADPEGNLWSFGTYRGTEPGAGREGK
jgi:uncharacterized glyoxalase superfamily protein PhnB